MATNELRNMAQSNNTSSDNSENAKTRTIIATFIIEDNDFIEYGLYNSLKCKALKDFTKLPDVNELYKKDSIFREISMKRKAANRAYNDYINKSKLK
jgi:hypothetical protein